MVFPENAIDRFVAEGFLQFAVSKAAKEAVTATFEAAGRFFRAPTSEKTLSTLPEDGGYRPFGMEYSRSPDAPDQMETFTASDRTRSERANLRSRVGVLLHERMLETFDALEPAAEALMIGLAGKLTGRPYGQKFRGAFRRWSRIQLNYSCPTAAKATFINEAHEDGVLVTFACSTGPGLELQVATGGFVPLTALPGELLAMAGEITWLITGGTVRPLYHRVRREPRCAERMALLFFGDIQPHLCDPWIINEINSGVDIGARVRASAVRFGLQGFSAE